MHISILALGIAIFDALDYTICSVLMLRLVKLSELTHTRTPLFFLTYSYDLFSESPAFTYNVLI